MLLKKIIGVGVGIVFCTSLAFNINQKKEINSLNNILLNDNKIILDMKTKITGLNEDAVKKADKIGELEKTINKQSAQIKNKNSEINKLKKNISSLNFKIKKLQEEAKEKVRKANLGKKLSEEAKEKVRKANLGKKLSEETKKKIGKAHKEHKYCLGRKLSEETRKKISEASPKKRKIVMLDKKTGEYLRTFESLAYACEFLGNGECYQSIGKVCRGVGGSKSAYGYRWMYYEDYIKLEQ